MRALRSGQAGTYVRVRDTVLTSRKQFQIISTLKDHAIVGGNVQKGRDDISSRARSHRDLFVVAEDAMLLSASERVDDNVLEIDSIDDA